MVKQQITCILLVFFIGFSGLAQDSLKTVVAVKGDGILSLLRKNGVSPYDYYDAFIGLNIKNLRDSVHLYEGQSYQIPKITDSIREIDSIKIQSKEIKEIKSETFNVFGEKYKTVVKKSERLKGNVYYLVSGHGGPDP